MKFNTSLLHSVRPDKNSRGETIPPIYQVSAFAYDSAEQLEKVFTLSFLRWDWNNYLAGRYPHAKLADDGTDFGPGQVTLLRSALRLLKAA